MKIPLRLPGHQKRVMSIQKKKKKLLLAYKEGCDHHKKGARHTVYPSQKCVIESKCLYKKTCSQFSHFLARLTVGSIVGSTFKPP
jgi:hypothetical protein